MDVTFVLVCMAICVLIGIFAGILFEKRSVFKRSDFAGNLVILGDEDGQYVFAEFDKDISEIKRLKSCYFIISKRYK